MQANPRPALVWANPPLSARTSAKTGARPVFHFCTSKRPSIAGAATVGGAHDALLQRRPIAQRKLARHRTLCIDFRHRGIERGSCNSKRFYRSHVLLSLKTPYSIRHSKWNSDHISASQIVGDSNIPACGR
ncbi:hypothetical protein [Burkholderia lata]|uniref:hypothetical protein n=1 Tax=Burkholderia lata (strain ATCC 17760 / DSM 23089 / LMG 22485 / NCIMB 9086 / R18194 / 383) TaxID=482957 RepID=UPI001583D0B2|nr:hypothetical protein [Burkholderia lata]